MCLGYLGVSCQESDYEDDCEAEDDAYSDTFEVEDADQPEVAWSSVAAAVAAAESNDAAESSNSNSPAAPAAAESGSGRSPPAPVADSEPSECDEYSEPEEDSPKLELELESEEEPENLVEAEASDDGRDTDSYGSYYAPSEASNANPKSDGGCSAKSFCLLLGSLLVTGPSFMKFHECVECPTGFMVPGRAPRWTKTC